MWRNPAARKGDPMVMTAPAFARYRFRLTCIALGAALLVSMTSGPHAAARREFPDTSARIAILTDQLPSFSTEQARFVASHFVGSQKLSLDLSRALRRFNPDFIVLHYKLAMWQSARDVPYIVDGSRWGNDFAEVDRHESWFWHNPQGQRVTSNQDRKLLMNVADPGFRAYWKQVLAQQVDAGEYDGVFFDSASPTLLQWEARTPPDPRLAGRGVRDNTFPELGNRSWIDAWEDWMRDLDTFMARRGIPVIPNIGPLVTGWDRTDYSLTAGVFLEGFAQPGSDPADWVSATNQTLDLVRKDRIVILQNYLQSPDEIARRKYLLANYLIVKGRRTYLSYYAGSTMQWFPEWELNLGAPRTSPTSVNDMLWQGIYRRDFMNGVVLLNPTGRSVDVTLETPLKRVEPVGGGPIDSKGRSQGSLTTTTVTTLVLPAKSAELLLR